MLSKAWNGSPAASCSLSPLLLTLRALSLPYASLCWVRNKFFDLKILSSRRLPCPVISVGNLSVGGTGKTPLTVMLAGMLKANGYRPAILSRGYGRHGREKIDIISDGGRRYGSPGEAGDEPFLMTELLGNVPVIVGADRFLSGKKAIVNFDVDLLILDDGFQHRCLHRDVDICLVEMRRPFGNGFLLPAGPLREPASALKRADIIVVTGNSQRYEGALLFPGMKLPVAPPSVFYCWRRPVAVLDGQRSLRPISVLDGKGIYAFAGIGNPFSFRETIESLGGRILGFSPYPDHHAFERRDLARIREEARLLGADLILTTEKDGARLREFPDFLECVHMLRIEMEVHSSRREEFFSLILDRVKESKAGLMQNAGRKEQPNKWL